MRRAEGATPKIGRRWTLVWFVAALLTSCTPEPEVVNNSLPHARHVDLPPAGQVSADAVDGSPVFVVHGEDGTIHVLDAVSPHRTAISKVLAWCASSGAFEDLWHGSIFDSTGRWIAGPAPTDMARYEVLEHTSDRVDVGQKQPAKDRPTMARDFELEGPDAMFAPPCPDRATTESNPLS